MIREIGPDADLLTRSDKWLEKERKSTAEQMSRLADQLYVIQIAQKIKQALQQKNLVALRQILKDSKGNVTDIMVRIISLPDAIAILSDTESLLEELNSQAQLQSMESDGYDLETSIRR